MLFLDLFKPVEWLSGVDDGIMGAIISGLRTLLFYIDTIIYELIIHLYNFFDMLCSARLLDNYVLNEISKRIGVILGIVMFMIVIFSFIKMLIDPDKISDKETGAAAIIKKVIIVILLLGISNFSFDTLYNVQKIIIDGNVISKMILPYEISDDDKSNFGNLLSRELMRSFYQINTFDNVVDIDDEEVGKKDNCINTTDAFLKQIYENDSFDLGYNCLNESVKVTIDTEEANLPDTEDELYIVNFNSLLSVIAGGLVAYILFMYCFGVGIRMIQLAFLEIISPMAIVSYLSPKKDNMFAKWFKLYSATYIDIFLRIAIINFVVFLILALFSSNAMDGRFLFWESLDNPTNLVDKSFFTVIIILALLTFAKKAPDLLKDLFPSSASKLGLGISMKDVVGLQKGFKVGTGVLGGAAAGTAVGILAGRPLGAVGGFLKGGISGLKGQGFTKTATGSWKNQAKANQTIANVRANGGNWLGYQMNQLQQGLGMRTAYDLAAGDVETLESFSKIRDQVESRADNNKYIKLLKKRYEAIQQSGKSDTETQDQYNRRVREAEKLWKDTRASMISAAMNDENWFVGWNYDDEGNLIRQTVDITAQEKQVVQALKEQGNRILNSDSSLFNKAKYNKIKTYEDLDNNTNQATDDITEKRTTRKYARDKANAGK